MIENMQTGTSATEIALSPFAVFSKWIRSEAAAQLVLLGLVVLIWLPRLGGPIDLRWDGGVYYILGTSLAEGKGYKLLNEPGEIDAVQYPPLLPLIIAGHQLILGTDNPTIVGWWLRFSSFIIFIIYIYVVFRFFKNHLSLHYAFLGTVLCLFSMPVYFLSDLCFPEIYFSLATVLFVLCLEKDSSRALSISAYLFAVASYALRTVGITAFAVWILDSLLKRKFKQAALRVLLTLVPIFCWQFYIASVESSDEYNHPAYAYQRAPYMFSNVSYARNIILRDPLAPEGDDSSASPVEIVRRFAHNAIRLPANLGETTSALRGYINNWLKFLFGRARFGSFTAWSAFLFLYALGLFVIGGIALQLWRRQWIVPLYVLPFLALMCLTPFPKQYARYLMPITPFLVLSLIVFLLTIKNISNQFLSSKWTASGKYLAVITLSVVLLTQLLCCITIYTQDHQKIAYFDKNNQFVEYPLFFDNKRQRDFDLCITYISQNAKPDEIVAAGTPHWIYLRTGLKAVMPPFKDNPIQAQQLLDSVPVDYLIIGKDVLNSEQYTLPVVQQFPEKWEKVYSVPESDFAVYHRISQ